MDRAKFDLANPAGPNKIQNTTKITMKSAMKNEKPSAAPFFKRNGHLKSVLFEVSDKTILI